MSEASALATAITMLAVDRAIADLRRGGYVLVENGSEAVLAQAAEAVTSKSLAELARLGGGRISLALTAQRASVLDLPFTGSNVVELPLSDGMDAHTIRWLIDPTAAGGGLMPRRIMPEAAADDSCASAAIQLSKLAQLLPAALTAPVPRPVAEERDAAASGDLLRVKVDAISAYPGFAATTLLPVSEARVPLEGAENARVVAFRPADGSIEQFAILIGEPEVHQPVLCRLHSECFTGDLLGSLRCDCGPQLQNAIQLMGLVGHGVLLYLAHEGRGIGLVNKLRAYQLQDAGLDTLDANKHLGFEPDERTYRAAAVMLGQLGISQVRLLTNNPKKVDALVREGVEVSERVPHAMAANRYNRGYLATKARRSGHWLDA